MERRGNRIEAAVSHDGAKWLTVNPITAELPRKLKLGVAAINTSERPFAVEFEEFRLTTR